MVVIKDMNSQKQPEASLFVAIGCFDGIHLAHKSILEMVIAGKQEGLKPAVFTFDINEDCCGKNMPRLMTTEAKLRMFEEMGIEVVFLLQFSQVKNITAENFVEDVLKNYCGAKKVCCGYNFRFGKGGLGDIALLRSLCEERNMETVVCEELDFQDFPVSSTRIRRLIQEGNITEANLLLGRPFSFMFPVIHGRKLGRLIGVPTINQALPDEFILPKKGVYSSETVVDGVKYCSVTNIGLKPTVGGETKPSAETWIQNFSGDLYGKSVQVSLHHYLREERKFESLEALREQILQDKKIAEQLYYSK